MTIKNVVDLISHQQRFIREAAGVESDLPEYLLFETFEKFLNEAFEVFCDVKNLDEVSTDLLKRYVSKAGKERKNAWSKVGYHVANSSGSGDNPAYEKAWQVTRKREKGLNLARKGLGKRPVNYDKRRENLS